MTKRQVARGKTGSTNTWASSLRNPFQHPAVHIPDDKTMVSGLVSSRELFTWTPTTRGAVTTVHSGGLAFFPHMAYAKVVITEDVTGGALSGLDLPAGVPAQYNISPSVSNFDSIVPLNTSAMARLTSLGLRVTYEGTELNRAGKIFAGTVPISYPATSTNKGIAPFRFEPLSVFLGTAALPTASAMKASINLLSSSRVSDREFEVNWVPSGVPAYQNNGNTTTAYVETSLAMNTTVAETPWSNHFGGAGNQSGQNALVLFLEGDVTTAASNYGNTYAVEVIYHWEVVPATPLKVAYDLTHSASNFAALQQALNAMGSRGREIPVGLTSNSVNTSQRAQTGRAMGFVRRVQASPAARSIGSQLYQAGSSAISNAARKAITSAVAASVPLAVRAIAGRRQARMIMPAR